MTRINLFRDATVLNTPIRRTPAILNSIAWGKINLGTTASPLVFGAVLIICSLAVGCTSEKPKTEIATNQPPATQPTPPAALNTTTTAPTTTMQAESKPVHKRVVRKAPVTVAYTDKTSGVSFQYSHRYALKTGDAADKLISSDPVPMNFAQPGGVAVAAVMVPEGSYPKSDLSSAFFDVSLNKSLTAEQCQEFSDAKPNPALPADSAGQPAAPLTSSKSPKLMIGDMELQSTETLANVGTGKEAAKYYHVFENGNCYEFALKVATTGTETEGSKHVDREEVFGRLEKILATVKINPVQEMTASTPEVTPAAPATPAQ